MKLDQFCFENMKIFYIILNVHLGIRSKSTFKALIQPASETTATQWKCLVCLRVSCLVVAITTWINYLNMHYRKFSVKDSGTVWFGSVQFQFTSIRCSSDSLLEWMDELKVLFCGFTDWIYECCTQCLTFCYTSRNRQRWWQWRATKASTNHSLPIEIYKAVASSVTIDLVCWSIGFATNQHFS